VRREQILQTLREHLNEMQVRFNVSSLRLFGSVARNESSEASDVDILVDFSGPRTFRGYMGLRIFLEDLLGVNVDLVTESGLRDRVRPHVEKDAIRVA
jgi:hypothetical protein